MFVEILKIMRNKSIYEKDFDTHIGNGQWHDLAVNFFCTALHESLDTVANTYLSVRLLHVEN